MAETSDWGVYPMPEDTEIYGKAWWVRAPWAHPVWHSYAILLYDLHTTSDKLGPATKKRPDLTHEIAVFALDPEQASGEIPIKRLEPANHLYQFPADSDEAAEQRISKIVASIVRQELSPDTDYRTTWDEIFKDGETLMVNSFGGLDG